MGMRNNAHSGQGLKRLQEATLKRASAFLEPGSAPAEAGRKEEPAEARLTRPVVSKSIRCVLEFRNSSSAWPLYGAFLIPPALAVVADYGNVARPTSAEVGPFRTRRPDLSSLRSPCCPKIKATCTPHASPKTAAPTVDWPTSAKSAYCDGHCFSFNSDSLHQLIGHQPLRVFRVRPGTLRPVWRVFCLQSWRHRRKNFWPLRRR